MKTLQLVAVLFASLFSTSCGEKPSEKPAPPIVVPQPEPEPEPPPPERPPEPVPVPPAPAANKPFIPGVEVKAPEGWTEFCRRNQDDPGCVVK